MKKNLTNTKTELVNMTTQEFKKILQESLKGFATKEDLDEKISSLQNDLNFSIKYEIREIKKEIIRLEDRIEKMYNLLDGFINNVLKLDEEFTFIKVQMDRLEKEMNDVRQQIRMVTCPEWTKKNGSIFKN
ncbi:hypothetical protein CVV26_01215 [Candidatus Kuenenbacteria bacterium HGW-Kuenenbacteria-1]|uniref:Uncharacterized protein n=1 Tax=Candidatus Kuenenbacteria bacterium HGW-Kuenenbacteria-1 TaxID=2013812 RepID=A0A2N1UP10_9BACT|nr:MAG: hypothetical protein CVV26_01215 [Candidatus Kuenenbacteria bacterium HGW-Kuenenbacteria-1]